MANVSIRNIYHMLSYAFQALRQTNVDHVAAENFAHIHDLFAAILVQGGGAQVKRGLHRDYVAQTEALAGLRGQIRVADTVKQQTQTQGRLVCSYDEFVPDSPHNRALKSVLLLLLRHGNVKAETKKSLRRLLPYFAAVSDIAPTSIRWDALQYHRHNASYRTLLGICRLTVQGLLQTTAAGTHRLVSWLQDEAMHRLFERFVLSYYARHHPELLPKAAYVDWDISGDERPTHLPVMKSDVTLQKGDRRMIIDTKYYSRTMQHNPLYDKRTFISGNLYQIYTYVKNSDKDATGNVAGVLLYAKTDEDITPDADLTIGGNRISLKTLDLNQNWAAITDQLDQICAWVTTA